MCKSLAVRLRVEIWELERTAPLQQEIIIRILNSEAFIHLDVGASGCDRGVSRECKLGLAGVSIFASLWCPVSDMSFRNSSRLAGLLSEWEALKHVISAFHPLNTQDRSSGCMLIITCCDSTTF